MWVVLRGGHVCAVAQDQVDPARLCVRFWNREDMDAAQTSGLAGFTVGPLNTDYPYRIVCEPEEAATWLARQVESIDYTKFKPTVDHAAPGGEVRSRVLLDVFYAFWDNLRDEPLTKAGTKKGAKVKVMSWLERRSSATDEAALIARLSAGQEEPTQNGATVQ